MAQRSNQSEMTIDVENVGGIESVAVTIQPGVTVLTGENATNRTSLLTAMAAALGGSVTNLKSDADQGRVRLTFDGETYSRTFERRDGTVVADGRPFSEETALVDTFVTLLENNPARRAIATGGDVRDVLLEPVDTAAIRRQISEFESERERIDRRLSEIDHELEDLPELERRRTELEAEIDEVTAEIERVRDAVDEYDADDAAATEAEAVVQELETARQEVASLDEQIETQQESIEALRDERANVSANLDSLPGSLEEKRRSIRDDIEDAERQVRDLGDEINDLTAVVDFNENLLDSDGAFVDDEVTAALDPDRETVECWTCGSEVRRGDIGDRIDRIRDRIDQKRKRREELRELVDDLRNEQRELAAVEDERAELTERLDSIDREIERRELKLDRLRKERTETLERSRELERQAQTRQELRDEDLFEHYEELSSLGYEKGQLEEQLDRVEASIREAESLREEKENLEAQRAEVREELETLRTRIEDIERNAIAVFNDHIGELLDELEYENVERIWVERIVEDTETEPPHESTQFQLHIVRQSGDGAVYEDVIDNLSESERELVGLVLALAGYLVHDVHELVPVMLLDSLEAIDADRIAALVNYFEDVVPFVVLALLPADARPLPDRYHYVTAETL